ncbi:MAG: SpoIIE family protein phosphatase [Bacteroidia bacterium]|nr:SpoIIE family protein phosphatase [Bacteroidia bacterium]MDW8158471.1 SpoIIE family protein phosphatase [Bacteroidia bacterium]
MKPVIICVDDEKAILSSLEQQIKHWFAGQYECELAQGGEEALLLVDELLEANRRIALIISDQIMPGIQGDELLVLLHQKLPEVPKILLTGQANFAAIQNAISNARLYRYISKPWEENDLMLTIQDALTSFARQLQLIEHNRLLHSLAEATQQISSQIHFSSFASLLLESAIRTIGAQDGYLVLCKDKKWFVAAAISSESSKNQNLQYWVQNKNFELLQSVLTKIQEVQGQDHPYRFSRLFAPISRKGKNLGFLFLEFFQPDPIFYSNRLEVLQMLANQAAICLENLQLYHYLAVQAQALRREKQKVEIINQVLNEKNKNITDSIQYARRIQEAIMPERSFLQQYFPNSFILYQPKDIVSGDFFWWVEKEHTFIIAAVDCTGHGVPGAFMSVIGSNLLNQIVNEYGITEPDAILQYLDHRVRIVLKQDDYGARDLLGNDSMELALCAYERTTRTLKFAGANRPLYLVHDGQLLEVPPTKVSIGGKKNEQSLFFRLHTFKINPGDCLYICTDGIADQLGGPEHKRFSTKRLKDLILALQRLPFVEQPHIISETIKEWRGLQEEQIDDILIIGILFE